MIHIYADDPKSPYVRSKRYGFKYHKHSHLLAKALGKAALQASTNLQQFGEAMKACGKALEKTYDENRNDYARQGRGRHHS